jgi:hypothetical protein
MAEATESESLTLTGSNPREELICYGAVRIGFDLAIYPEADQAYSCTRPEWRIAGIKAHFRDSASLLAHSNAFPCHKRITASL